MFPCKDYGKETKFFKWTNTLFIAVSDEKGVHVHDTVVLQQVRQSMVNQKLIKSLSGSRLYQLVCV